MKYRDLLFFFTLFLCIAWQSWANAEQPNLDFKNLDFKSFQFDADTNRYSGSNGEILKITSTVISVTEARKILRDQLYQHGLYFQPQTAPYPGMLTKDASCLKGVILPKKVSEDGSAISWFSEMPATSGLVYGTSGSIEEPYWSQKLLLYCKKEKTLFDVRIFKLRADKAFTWGSPIASCR